MRKCKCPYSILLKKHKLTKIIDLVGIGDGTANHVVELKAARGCRLDREQNNSEICSFVGSASLGVDSLVGQLDNGSVTEAVC